MARLARKSDDISGLITLNPATTFPRGVWSFFIFPNERPNLVQAYAR